MVLKLNLRAAITAEAVSGKAFRSFDTESGEDVLCLLYGMAVGGGLRVTYEVFCNGLKRHEIGLMAKEAAGLIAFNAALSEVSEEEDEEEVSEQTRMRDLAALLVVRGGLHPGYVMDEMQLCDIEMYIKAIVNKERGAAEWARHWAFVGLSPYLKASDTKHNAVPLPWDEEEAGAGAVNGAEVAEMLRKMQEKGING